MSMTKEFLYSFNDNDYLVKVTFKKGMRSITYRFKDGCFKVSSPYLVSLSRIKQGLDKYAPKLLNRSYETKAKSDDFIYILGVKIEIDEKGDITTPDGIIISYKSKEDLEKKLRKYFLDLVTRRARYYETQMNVPSYTIRVKNMTTRFGSNSKKTKTIYFSTMLLHYSLELIDSVVVHELAHILVFNHSKKFYDIVYKYYPNYDACHTKLRKVEFK